MAGLLTELVGQAKAPVARSLGFVWDGPVREGSREGAQTFALYAPRPRPSETVVLRTKITGEEHTFARLDAREILSRPSSIYEPIKETVQ